MSNVAIGYSNFVDAATLTAGIGSWSVGAPLANIQNPVVAVAARSTDALAASTRFQLDLGAAQSVGLVALSGVNLTAAAKIRVRGGSVSGLASGVIYNGATIDAWPTGTAAATLAEHHRWTVVVTFTMATARYWLIEITDAANPDGYVQIGRAFLGPVFQPTWNVSYGARASWINRNERDETESGVIYTSWRPARRETAFSLDHLTRSEAITTLGRLQRITARSPEIVLAFDPAVSDATRLEESYLAELQEFDPRTYAGALRYASGFTVREKL